MSSIKSIEKQLKLKELLSDKGLIEAGSSPTITPLSGGFWNAVYRVKTTSFDWIVKCMEEDTDSTRLYPNLPKHEAEALKLLEGLDIAAPFVSFSEAEGDTPAILIYEFVTGKPLIDLLNDLDTKLVLSKAADLLATVHLIDQSNGTVSDVDRNRIKFRQLPNEPASMINLAANFLQELPVDSNIQRLRKHKSVLENRPQLMQVKTALLHTDAWSGNCIYNTSTEKLSLIDWQCPAIGDPTFDLWTFVSAGFNLLAGESLFSLEEKQYFVKQYKLASGDNSIHERLTYFAPYYAYQIAAHGCQRIVALAEDNPEASLAYQQVFDFQLAELDQENT